MAQMCYVYKPKSVDVQIVKVHARNIQEGVDMRWPDAGAKQPEETIDPDEAEIQHRGRHRPALTPASSADRSPTKVYADFVNQPRTSMQVESDRAGDHELPRGENPLGCARGVLFALALEAGLVLAIAAFWRLFSFHR
jgi:hypothetical protein